MKADEKFVLQVKKISEVYNEAFVPNEAKLQIITAMKEASDEFYEEMMQNLKTVKG